MIPKNRTATYNSTNKKLTYWVRKNTQETIDCISVDAAKMTLLAHKHITNLNQKLEVIDTKENK